MQFNEHMEYYRNQLPESLSMIIGSRSLINDPYFHMFQHYKCTASICNGTAHNEPHQHLYQILKLIYQY